VTGVVEKPAPEAAPSRYGIYGRYLFEAGIFEYFDRLTPDRRGEIQLSDALALYCRDHPVYAVRFEGSHYDVGNRLGVLEASVETGLKDPELGSAFREFLASLTTGRAATKA
jgi:UTP--glucose-1-phosphate uridylyltransferase